MGVWSSLCKERLFSEPYCSFQSHPVRFTGNLHHSAFGPELVTGFLSSFICPRLFVPASLSFVTVRTSFCLLDSSALCFCLDCTSVPVSISVCMCLCGCVRVLAWQRGLSCHRCPLQWLSQIPPFSYRQTVPVWLSLTLWSTLTPPHPPSQSDGSKESGRPLSSDSASFLVSTFSSRQTPPADTAERRVYSA